MTATEAAGRLRAIIVDDEPLARDCVRLALESVDGIEIVAECANGREAVGAIRSRRPDLVFLDVQMPGLDGFGVIEEVGAEMMPGIVFVTAYDEHALHAFEVHALDYVLKPFDDARLREAARHAAEQVRARRDHEWGRRLTALLRDLPAPGPAGGPAAAVGPVHRILVRDRDRIRFVNAKDVDWLEAAGNYVRVHVGTEAHLIRATLRELAERLDPATFVRIHRSTIVNVHRIREVQPWVGGDYLAVLRDGRQLKVSRVYRDALLKPLA